VSLMRSGPVRMRNPVTRLITLRPYDNDVGAPHRPAPTRRSSNEVVRDAKYCDAGQDQKRHCASYAAPQTIAREMTAHGLEPSDTFNQPTVAGFLGSARCQGLRPT
jgi:hypothetical protein